MNPHWMPTELERLVLEAALGQGDSAVAAWRKYYGEVALEGMPMSTFRLLGLVHANLAAQGYTGEEMGRVKGIRRRLWVEGEQLLFRCLPVLRELPGVAGRVALLKGAPMAAVYYKDFGLRPMTDIDILIPEDAALPAMAWLSEQGFKCTIYPEPRRVDREFLTYRHGANYAKGDIEIDLHWHVSPLATRPGADSELWRDVEPLNLKGLRLETLGAEGHLYHAVVHGVLWNPFPAFRWVADAVTILRAKPAFDWDRFLGYARRLRVENYVAPCLRYLREDFGSPVPERVLTELESRRLGFCARSEFARQTLPVTTQSAAVVAAGTWHQYRRTGAGIANLPRIARYFGYTWNLQDWDTAKREINRWRQNRRARTGVI